MLNIGRLKEQTYQDSIERQLHIMCEANKLLNAEVAKLREENADLKDQVERLTLDLFHTKG